VIATGPRLALSGAPRRNGDAPQPAIRTRGNSRTVDALRRAIAAARPPHALLLVGPRHVGKTTLALDLAAGLLCQAANAALRPCGHCLACRKVDHGTHPDVHRVAPSGAGGQVRLGQIHELQSALSFLPFEGRFRIAIVEGADRLNPDAQNAFLKTLEEPPASVCIVLAVEDESLLLPTVVSRCARYVLVPAARDAVESLLVERGVADAGRAAALARIAAGRPGLALALARDPDAMLARDRLLRTVLDLARADRRTRLGAAASLLADGAAIADAIDRPAIDDQAVDHERAAAPLDDAEASPAGGNGAADRAADEHADAGSERPTSSGARSRIRPRAPAPAERRRATLAVIDAWRGLARDVALAVRGGRAEIAHVDLLEELASLADEIDEADLRAFLGLLDELDPAVEAYANPELVLDVLLLRWPRPRRASRTE
jgi:DNA polymerase-3 subunit delta'